MPEIDRLNNAIDAHFEILGARKGKGSADVDELYTKRMNELVEPLDRCLFVATTKACSVPREERDQAALDRIEAAEKEITTLRGEIAAGTATAERFKEVAFQAMAARRAIYPLEGSTPWETVTPEAALRDDNDPYSFSIFDTVTEPIQDALPALHQLACEDWEDSGPLPECENGEDDD